MALVKFKGKPPEVIKIAHAVAPDVFFDSSNDYEPLQFDSSLLQEIYGDQIFFDVTNDKNLVVLSEAISGTCLENMKDFISGESFIETRYLQSAEGEDLIDSYGNGATLTYVSGTGVDQIFDLAPLSDDRFDKGAYIGNGAGKPEYYDFPYSANIYYDAANPTYWKIKDFHYRYYEEQADALTNLGFAKLTYSSGVLQSSDELLLYLDAKSLTFLSDGVAYKASTDAYGEWEFLVNKTGELDLCQIQFINSDASDYIGSVGDRYSIVLFNTERLYLIKKNNGSASPIILFETALSYFQVNTDYNIKITRNSVTDEYVTGAVGTFAAYIKGGSFGSNYVLIDVSGGSGTNPVTDNSHTTSAYTTFELDEGNKISNYTINGTRLNMADFTPTAGAFAANSELEGTELTEIKTYIGILPDYYGDNLVINGTFDTDTDWTKGLDWTISGGTANSGGGINNLSQDVGGITGMCCYKLDFDIIAFSGAVLSAFPGTSGTQFGAYTSTGHKTATATWDGSDSKLYFNSLLYTGSIDNVVLKRLYKDFYNNEE